MDRQLEVPVLVVRAPYAYAAEEDRNSGATLAKNEATMTDAAVEILVKIVEISAKIEEGTADD
jgi:hypothetical protein